jgi:regulator of replication initiation timing
MKHLMPRTKKLSKQLPKLHTKHTELEEDKKQLQLENEDLVKRIKTVTIGFSD